MKNTIVLKSPPASCIWDCPTVIERFQRHIQQKTFEKFIRVVVFLSFLVSYICRVSASTVSSNTRVYIFGVRFPDDRRQQLVTRITTTRGGTSSTATGNNTSTALDRYTSTEEQELSPPPPPPPPPQQPTSGRSIHPPSLPLETYGSDVSTFIANTDSTNSGDLSSQFFSNATTPLPPPSEEHLQTVLPTEHTVTVDGKHMLAKERRTPITLTNMSPLPPPPTQHQSSNNLFPVSGDGNLDPSVDDDWSTLPPPPPPPPPTQLPHMVEEDDEITIPHIPPANITSDIAVNVDSSAWEVSRNLLGMATNVLIRPKDIRSLADRMEDIVSSRPDIHPSIISPSGLIDQDNESITAKISVQDELQLQDDLILEKRSLAQTRTGDDPDIVTVLQTSLSTIQSQLRQQQLQQKKMMNVWLYLFSLSIMNFQRQRRQEHLEGQFLTKLVQCLLVLYPPRQQRLFDNSMVGRDLSDDEFDSLLERIENWDHSSHDMLLDYLEKHQPTMAEVDHEEKSVAVIHNDDAVIGNEEETSSNILDHDFLDESDDEDSNFLTEEEQRLLDESSI